MAQSTYWDRMKTGSKSGFDKTWKAVDKIGAPVNKLSNKLGSEAFWPTTLDKESDKAARILKSFCKDGFYSEEEQPAAEGPKQKQKVVKKIPTEVVKRAKGLAIFTTMRTGLWMSGAGGSGVLLARKPDGTWSPPSGILLHTAGLGFLVGIDIYDCVVVINTDAALEAFTKIRCTLGSEISVAAGPVGAGGILDSELHKRQAAIFTYLKSRGFYAGVQIDGTVIIERTDENERFYGQRIPVKDILAGKVRHPPYEVRRLLETVKAAQGDRDVDENILPTEAPPGDYEIDDGQIFGLPAKEDPDPYGVLALEKEGMTIKEAGTHKRASWETFSFNPVPTSPVHTMYAHVRNSSDGGRTLSQRSSWRTSAFGNEPKSPASVRNSVDTQRSSSLMTDMATQTDFSELHPASPHGHSRRSSKASVTYSSHGAAMQEVPENDVLDTSPTRSSTTAAAANVDHVNGITTPPRTPPLEQNQQQRSSRAIDADDLDHDESEIHIEEPVVHSVQKTAVQPPASAVQPQLISKARIVNVPKRIPPKLPPRNPNRNGVQPVAVQASESSSPLPNDDALNVTTTADLITSPVSPDSRHDSGRDDAAISSLALEQKTAPAQAKTERRKLTTEDDEAFDPADAGLDGEDQEEQEETLATRGDTWAKVDETRQKEHEEKKSEEINLTSQIKSSTGERKDANSGAESGGDNAETSRHEDTMIPPIETAVTTDAHTELPDGNGPSMPGGW